MNLEELKKLNRIFMILNQNIGTINYFNVRKRFKQKLEECLKEQFGAEINFDKNDYYIHGYYKGTEIRIDIFSGFILWIKDKEYEFLASDFKDIFTKIIGTDAICSYDFCSNYSGKKTVYSIVEWNLKPEERINGLAISHYYPAGGWIENFKDYYTPSIIHSLGNSIFTIDGYNKIFETEYIYSTDYKKYILKEIHKLYSDVSMSTIYNWFHENGKAVIPSEELGYSKVYVNNSK